MNTISNSKEDTVLNKLCIDHTRFLIAREEPLNVIPAKLNFLLKSHKFKYLIALKAPKYFLYK